jgi:hypothetical protein
MLEFEKIKNTPISLVNENNYKKPEINHLAINAETINLEKINYNEKQYNNEKQNLNNFQENNQIFSLNKEILELKRENDSLKAEINNLKETFGKNKMVNSEGNYSINNSNINLLTDDIRELGLFRRIKESLVPNYSELSFEELSNKFNEIIIEYKKKYNIEEIILNMENEFNNEISKFNNIISLQQEQKRDSLNKINYLFTKENNLEENNNYLKVNQYLMEQLNELISDKETNIKIINQLKGDIIKLKTEINLYKANYNKNKQINNLKKVKMINAKNNYINNNINENIEKNNLISQENQMKNYIDFNIDKYSIGYNKNKNIQNYMNDKGENDIYNVDEDKDFINPINYNVNYINGNNFNNQKKKKTKDNLGLFDDYQRVSILAENSQDNSKYQEIIKQKELIVNGIK